jgi:hypothetical protein
MEQECGIDIIWTNMQNLCTHQHGATCPDAVNGMYRLDSLHLTQGADGEV